MPTQALRDVLGGPETWRSFVPITGDAVIANVIASDEFDRIVVVTRNGSAIPTYSTIAIADAEMRSTIIRLMQPGMTVEDALEAEF